MQRRTLLFFLIVVVLALGAAYVDLWPNANSRGQSFHGLNNPFTLKQGLDLQGGVSVLLLPDPRKHYDPATINSSM
jgi:preprotein translocase subunit SecD